MSRKADLLYYDYDNLTDEKLQSYCDKYLLFIKDTMGDDFDHSFFSLNF